MDASRELSRPVRTDTFPYSLFLYPRPTTLPTHISKRMDKTICMNMITTQSEKSTGLSCVALLACLSEEANFGCVRLRHHFRSVICANPTPFPTRKVRDVLVRHYGALTQLPLSPLSFSFVEQTLVSPRRVRDLRSLNRPEKIKRIRGAGTAVPPHAPLFPLHPCAPRKITRGTSTTTTGRTD